MNELIVTKVTINWINKLGNKLMIKQMNHQLVA